MKRPQLIRFMAIATQSKISVRASLNYFSNKESGPPSEDQSLESPSTPLESLSLLGRHQFRMKLRGLNQDQDTVFHKVYESDAYGDFDIKIDPPKKSIHSFQIFETSCLPGMDMLLGTRLPIKMQYPKQMVICDFDKTLVNTRYATPQEVYESLRSPLNTFPTINSSLHILADYIQQQYQPFIISASPHFYENAIRNWLYQNDIYTAEIFLKDYRRILSILDAAMTTKDVKSQGFYKLKHLASILLMTGIPDKLALIGDGFESDPLIYLVFASLLQDQIGPWDIWKQVKKLKAFRMNRRQDTLFLNKVYQLQNEIKKKGSSPQISIHIYLPKHVKKMPIPLTFFKQSQYPLL